MSRIWKKEDRLFVFDQNTLILNNQIEDLLFKLQSSISKHIELPNIVDTYTNKIKEIIEFLDKHGIDYYSDDFTFDSIITEILQIDIKRAERELMRAINKTKKPLYKTFINTNFVKFIIKSNINNYNMWNDNISNFNFENSLEMIVEYKYTSKTSEYLNNTKDKDIKTLKKLDRKDLIFFINNCISK